MVCTGGGGSHVVLRRSHVVLRRPQVIGRVFSQVCARIIIHRSIVHRFTRWDLALFV